MMPSIIICIQMLAKQLQQSAIKQQKKEKYKDRKEEKSSLYAVDMTEYVENLK